MYKDYETITEYVTDVQAINNAIRNILLTQKGSLPGKPRFGSKIHELLFVNLDHITESLMKKYIEEALSELEPRIIVNDVSINISQEYNKIIANIYYSFRDKGVVINEKTAVIVSQNT